MFTTPFHRQTVLCYCSRWYPWKKNTLPCSNDNTISVDAHRVWNVEALHYNVFSMYHSIHNRLNPTKINYLPKSVTKSRNWDAN